MIVISKAADVSVQPRVLKTAELVGSIGNNYAIVHIKSEMRLVAIGSNRILGSKTKIPKAFFKFSMLRRITKLLMFFKYIMVSKPQTFIAHDFISFIAGVILSYLKKNIKLIYMGDELEIGRNYSYIKNRIIRYSFAKYSHRYNYLVQADYYRARILQKFVKKQVMLVRNVPNLVSKFHRLSIQQKYNLKPNSIICIYGGIITKARKLDPTIIALAEISKLRPIFCMMVGWGAVDDISYYKDLFNSLAFNHKEFSGIISKPLPMNQLMNLYYSSDIGIGTVPNINTSYYYCVPSKVYEYMMAGIPFIASKSPETKRLVKETGAGLLVNPESKEDIISSIQESIVDKNKLKIMGDSGRQWAISKYNWEIESRELLKIIN